MKNKKEKDVRLTEKEIKRLTAGMSRQERKEFEKRQKQMEEDQFWDAAIFMEAFMDD